MRVVYDSESSFVKFAHYVLQYLDDKKIDVPKSFPDLVVYLGLRPEFQFEMIRKKDGDYPAIESWERFAWDFASCIVTKTSNNLDYYANLLVKK